MKHHVRTLILFGEDAGKLEDALHHDVAIQHADDLEAAVIAARNAAKPGDAVLFSPACASFDMFKNFEHRGDVFTELVNSDNED